MANKTGEFSQQEEPAVLLSEVRRHLLRRDDAIRALSVCMG